MFLSDNQTNDCCNRDGLIEDYAIFLQNLLLILSNFFLLPAVYLSVKCRYFGEAFIYFMTMFCSAFYHMCDNSQMKFCLVNYDVLQFTDFYSAILTLWVTAILMSDISHEWRSTLHLGGSLFFAGLLRAKTTGALSFVVPGACAIVLLALSWSCQYYQKRVVPSSLSIANLIPGAVLSLIGAVLFASQVTKFGEFYGYTHSGWHICMSLAITFLLPKTRFNRYKQFDDYCDQICVLSIPQSET